MPRYKVGIHKVSKRRGSIIPISWHDWEPGYKEVNEFDFVEVSLSPKQKADLINERIVLDPVTGVLSDVPEHEWPERKAELDEAVGSYQNLVAQLGEEGARRRVQEMAALQAAGVVE